MTKAPPAHLAAESSPFAWVYRFDGEGHGAAVPAPSPETLHETPGGFVWLHINLADQRCRQWIGRVAAVPDDAREMLLDADDHQRLSLAGAALWGVFVDFGRTFDGEDATFAWLRVVVGERFVITARRHPVQAAELMRRAIENGRSIATPLELFEALGGAIVGAMASAVDRIGAAIYDIEDDVLGAFSRDDGRRLGLVHRDALRLQRRLTAQHNLLARIDDAAYGGGAHATIARLLQKLDGPHHELRSHMERARLLHDEVAAKLAADINRQLYALTVLGTLLIPPTLVTGFFGMNTKNLFFSDIENGTWIAAGLAAGSALIGLMTLFWTGRRRARGRAGV